MNDIDFDELDQAVTSLLGKPTGGGDGAEKAKPQSPQQTPQPVHQEPAQIPPQKPVPSLVTKSFTPPKRSEGERSRGETPVMSNESESNRPPSQVGPLASTSLQKSEPKPSTLARSTELSASNTKFPITPTAPVSEPRPIAKPVPAASPVTPAAPKPKPASPSMSRGAVMNGMHRRPGGRFMDVVHPAAPKPKEAPQRPASVPPSTPPQTPAQPVVSPKVPTSPDPERMAPQVKVSASPQNPLVNRPSRVSHAGKAISVPSSASSQQLDDLVPRKPQAAPPAPPANNDRSSEQPAKASTFGALFGKKTADEPLLSEKAASHPETTSASKAAEGIPSPFLTDTKVQKRPLGGLMSSNSHTDKPLPTAKPKPAMHMPSFAEKDEPKESEEQLAPTPTSLPPELAQDIVEVEARDPKSSERPDTPPAFAPEKPKNPQPVSTARSAGQAASTATLSIPQQYKTRQSEPDKTPRSIYDTEEYHKPLPAASSKKKKAHPAVWTLLVILLLAVGAGLGVAVYFLFG